MENLPDAPHHALVDHALADTEPVPELQRAFRKADRARALADPIGVVEQHDALATLRQIDRKRQPDRPCAHHHNRTVRDIAIDPILIGVATITELGLGLRHAHIALARGYRPRYDSRICNYLNSPRVPPSTQIGAIVAKSVFERNSPRVA